MSRRQIPRRRFLRGSGAAVALPLLDQMIAGTARGQPALTGARRFVGFFVPNGFCTRGWRPTTEGTGFELSPILQPLAPVKNDVLVIAGLCNRVVGNQAGGGGHARGNATFLTIKRPALETVQNGVSLDQVMAQTARAFTPFPSIQLGTTNTREPDGTWPAIYKANVSWASETQPLPKEIDPQAAFDRLFSSVDVTRLRAGAASYRRRLQSILDRVRDDAAQLSRRLGPGDRRRVDEYLTGVRELEVRIQSFQAKPTCVPPAAPGRPAALPDRTRAMLDLIVTAFQCDLTRVATFMLEHAQANTIHKFLGNTGAHHYMSHHGGGSSGPGDPDKMAQLQKIETWEIAQLAHLLQRLKAIAEPDGRTLLDNSIVYFSTDVTDGDTHSYLDLPVIVGGRGGGAITPGRFVRYGGRITSTSDIAASVRAGLPSVATLFVAFLAAMGSPVTSFSDADAPLPNLKV
jgi:hypothetical protein